VLLTWAHERIARPQNSREWFTSLAHAEAIIEAWRREYNEERPRKGLGGLTPAVYGRRLIRETSTVTAGL
jgi:putative transposase